MLMLFKKKKYIRRKKIIQQNARPLKNTFSTFLKKNIFSKYIFLQIMKKHFEKIHISIVLQSIIFKSFL